MNRELFLDIDELRYIVDRWRMDYNHYRPHSSLGYMTPSGFAEQCRRAGCIRPHTPECLMEYRTVESSHRYWTKKRGQINNHYSAIIHRVERDLLAAHHDASDCPTTTLAFAQSLDGSISGKTGTRIQLSNPRSQTMTHHLRARHGAILVGINTVLVDDPQLTVRRVDGPSPRPVVVDSSLRLPPRARMMNGGGVRPLIATTIDAPAQREDRLRSAGAEVIRLPADHVGRVDLAALLRCLYRLNIRSLMVEGGAGIITSFLVAGLADRLVLTICPVLLWGVPAINSQTPAHPGKLPPLYEPEYASCDGDLILCANLSKPMNGRS